MPEATTFDLPIVAHLHFNLTALPFLRGSEVRRWLGRQIDREELVEAAGGSMTPLYAHTDLWEPHREWPSDLISDRRPARLPQRYAGAEVMLSYAAFPPNGAVVRRLADKLSDLLNLRVTPKALDYASYVSAVASGSYEMIYTLNPAPSGTAEDFMVGYRGTEIVRHTDFDDLLDKAQAARSLAVRRRYLRSAAHEWLGLMPFIPLAQLRGVARVNPGLEGCEFMPDGTVRVERARQRPRSGGK